MSKRRVALIILLIAGLAACSADGPAQTEREHAFLQYVKDNGSDDARIEDFKSGKCTKAEGAPSYVVTSTFNLTHRGNFKLTRLP
ncbi:hypothetical protein ABQW55_016960 [Xanthomonas citri pv. malvacearum]|uniref:Lipoprotein n=1 Tax=Xanthomonas campestris pv. malvacearum TaxID=86040 RepID=A0AA44Z0Y8_XANCM|nr:hypothetical protein [Xanthomonas citri]PUE93217.1 hypothetical protein C7T86_12335 [Xanthomonas citri pv. malvacearum]WAW94430.1 hypothetical protein LGM68_16900 [Xanthomonas citri pv. malvacearum]